jgi:CRP/FNR family cyclic AMP-dependent transcriptional regulator
MDPIKISPELLAKAGASSIRLAPGDVVFKDGDAPDKMYVVLSGEVEILLRDTVIETVPQGGTFGEMALIDGSPRSATYRENGFTSGSDRQKDVHVSG